jgi:predicted ATPase
VVIVARAVAAGAQFVIATHSPILLATPGARIYELDERGIAPCAYDELDTVRLMRGFLDAPERFIRAALDE